MELFPELQKVPHHESADQYQNPIISTQRQLRTLGSKVNLSPLSSSELLLLLKPCTTSKAWVSARNKLMHRAAATDSAIAEAND
jgi:hypothetical protein